MSIENKEYKKTKQEIESYHFDPDPEGEIDTEFFLSNEAALTNAKKLLVLKEAKLKMETGSDNLLVAIVRDNNNKIIFSTTLPSEIQELYDVVHPQ